MRPCGTSPLRGALHTRQPPIITWTSHWHFNIPCLIEAAESHREQGTACPPKRVRHTLNQHGNEEAMMPLDTVPFKNVVGKSRLRKRLEKPGNKLVERSEAGQAVDLKLCGGGLFKPPTRHGFMPAAFTPAMADSCLLVMRRLGVRGLDALQLRCLQ